MPERTKANAAYRYGFNGKENDYDMSTDGLPQDYGMRIYEPRLGRFFSVDPLTKEYPWNSTYAFAENDVIRSVDLDGLERYFTIGGTFLGLSIKGGDNGVVKIATEMSVKGNIIIATESHVANSERTLNARDQGANRVIPTGITKLDNKDIGRILAFGTQVIKNNQHYIMPVLMTAKEESIGTADNGQYGLLDFKYVAYDLLNIPANNLLEINGTVYNANEAGNFLWGMVLTDNGSLVNPAWAANRASENGPEHRPDEPHEQKAINSGIAFANNIPSEAKKEKDKNRGSWLNRLFGGSNKAKEDIKRVSHDARNRQNQDGTPIDRNKPNQYSGN